MSEIKSIDDVVALPLEPGHRKSFINELKDFLNDQRADLACYVNNKDFDEATKLANEIGEIEVIIESLETDIREHYDWKH